jgi:hypothetical protein
MMKRTVYVAFAILFLLAGLSSVALAAQNVGNPSQKGSVVVYPKIVVERDPTSGVVTADTVVTMVNDFTSFVDIKCYWMDEWQEIQDFVYRITRNQIVWFRASDGMGMDGSVAVEVPYFDGTYGELKCWAINPEGTKQISWNHLFGSATIYDYERGEAWEYSTWNFSARNVARGAVVTPPGKLVLSGQDGAYDACPQYVLGAFMADGSDFTDSDGNIVDLSTTDLTLVPCKQDLRQDRTPTFTKAQFDIWNEDEVKSTGAYICFKCWLETTLAPSPAYSAGAGTYRNFDKFGVNSLHTTYGFFRVTGVASTACKAADWSGKFPGLSSYATVASPLIGVISKSVTMYPVGGTPSNAETGTTLNTAGFDNSGFVWWDPQDPHPEANGR